MSLVWLDLETTGLSSAEHDILEVAAIVTDDALNEVARFERVVYCPFAADLLDAHSAGMSMQALRYISGSGSRPYVDSKVIEMHLANGLWVDCMYGQARDTVDRDLADFVQGYATTVVTSPEATDYGQPIKPQLAGSTISFDRGFIERHMPRTNKTLHHRNLDVSTLNEIGRRFWPEVYAARSNNKDKAHRGMADIEESIRVCKHYLARLAPVNVSASGAVPVVVTSENVGRMQ